MTGLAPRLPAIVPMFTELRGRGLKRAHIAVYGAVVAYEALQYVPTCVELAQAANLNTASGCRDVRRAIAYLVKVRLLERVRYSTNLSRYLPLGPRMQPIAVPQSSPANDNGDPA